MFRFLLALALIPLATAAYAVSCPQTLVVVSCKGQPVGVPDQNGFLTHEWVIKDSMLVCKREELPLQDVAETQGAAPLASNFSNPQQCARTAMMIAPGYEQSHRGWFVLTVGCPTPIVNRNADGTETIIGYQMPACPSWVRCEQDSVI
jgi:hypothetical protein